MKPTGKEKEMEVKEKLVLLRGKSEDHPGLLLCYVIFNTVP